MVPALLLASFLGASARAQVAPACEDLAGPAPDGYDEQAQLDFLANHAALASTFSPLHGPIPHEPGHGAIGVDVAIVPPVGCERRFVAQHSRTRDTQGPVLVRPRVTFALPALGKVVPYAGLAYVPPIRVGASTHVVVSGELGAGVPLGERASLGLRLHATSQKTVGELATPAADGDPAFEDLLAIATMGADLLAGWRFGTVAPYVAVGITDASTAFYEGDANTITNNFHPYLGPTFSIGADALVGGRLRVGAEAYGATGGYVLPDPEAPTVTPISRYGQLYTGRLRVAIEL